MKPPFFNLGTTTTESAFDSTSAGTEPPLGIAVKTLVALLMVSSSFVLLAPQAGRIDSSIRTSKAGAYKRAMRNVRVEVIFRLFEEFKVPTDDDT
jgi:hypothetical protein